MLSLKFTCHRVATRRVQIGKLDKRQVTKTKLLSEFKDKIGEALAKMYITCHCERCLLQSTEIANRIISQISALPPLDGKIRAQT